MAALMEAGIFRTLKPSEQRLVACLDKHTNRDTGLCCPGEKTIREETGLSHDSIWRARKNLRGRFFEIVLAKYNRSRQPVYHYAWTNIPSSSRGKGSEGKTPSASTALPDQFSVHFQGQPVRCSDSTGPRVGHEPSYNHGKKNPPTPRARGGRKYWSKRVGAQNYPGMPGSRREEP